MNQTEFWQLIDATHQAAVGSLDSQETKLIEALAQHSLDDIVDFERLFRQYILAADDFGIIAAQKIIQGWVSDDSYLYSRCWLISQGEQVFFEALRNPDALAELAATQGNTDFEPLLYVADKAFAVLTGMEEDESFPRNIAYEQGLDYDGSTETKDEDWTEEQLPALLPRLWSKFN
ncbi:DUF4240 domain-containing protein [Hymenobacter setariae]|uniref:DUF4240 domain-containing protein n=1 Tax=Hymenobacter setariae TaxID=2594794 RepID=A0A558BUA3_9BACT|nr:DUF4240 domain-containing protein [Hymenobacter setariae]TVT40053.1 DUF4240 domain-containing protein [Hymenobacter setariae]